MPVREALRHQDLDRVTEQLAPIESEQAFGLGIDHQDPPLAVDEHHGVRRRFEKRAELGLGPFPIAEAPMRLALCAVAQG